MYNEIEKKESLKKETSRGLELFRIVDEKCNTYYEVKQHQFSFFSEQAWESIYLYDKLYNTFGK